jgi:hypothetical protein
VRLCARLGDRFTEYDPAALDGLPTDVRIEVWKFVGEDVEYDGKCPGVTVAGNACVRGLAGIVAQPRSGTVDEELIRAVAVRLWPCRHRCSPRRAWHVYPGS